MRDEKDKGNLSNARARYYKEAAPKVSPDVTSGSDVLQSLEL